MNTPGPARRRSDNKVRDMKMMPTHLVAPHLEVIELWLGQEALVEKGDLVPVHLGL